VTGRVFAIGGDSSFRPLVARALLTSPEAIGWVSSIETADRTLSTARRLQLVVLGPTVTDDEAAKVAEYMTRESPSTAVVLVRDDAVNGSFPRLVRAGIRDVVDLSTGTAELEEALRRAIDWSVGVRAAQGGDEEQSLGTVVSVFSTKGGTGKTFLSCNLAVALASKLNQPVALLDLDHDLGDVFAYFNSEPRRALQDLADLGDGAEGDAIAQLGTPLAGNVVGYGSPPDPQAQPLQVKAVDRIIGPLQRAFPFVVVDGSAEYSDHVLAAFDISDIVCLITGLDVIGVRHLSLGMRTLQSLGIPRDRYRVILNRADSKVDLTAAEIEKVLGVHVDARIPSSAFVPRSTNHGRILYLEYPKSEVAKSVGDFAEQLIRQFAAKPVGMSDEAKSRGFLRRS
jgi:pilus assembly protein CpaE